VPLIEIGPPAPGAASRTSAAWTSIWRPLRRSSHRIEPWRIAARTESTRLPMPSPSPSQERRPSGSVSSATLGWSKVTPTTSIRPISSGSSATRRSTSLAASRSGTVAPGTLATRTSPATSRGIGSMAKDTGPSMVTARPVRPPISAAMRAR
jgi:hypothetical protein